MITVEELAVRLDRVEAELALHRLAHDYCAGVDHRDLPRWAAIWTTDAVWQTSPDQAFTGIEAICAAVQQQWLAFPVMQHATANHTVDIDNHTATGRSDVVVLVQLRDGRWIVGGGTYHDQYRREPDGWRIARRDVIRSFDLAPLSPSPGTIHMEDE
jgi:ketosteroid isomerase-like protein